MWESMVTLRDVDIDEVLKSLTLRTRPSQKEKLTFDEKKLPKHYRFVEGQDDELSFEPGRKVELQLERVTHQVRRGHPFVLLALLGVDFSLILFKRRLKNTTE